MSSCNADLSACPALSAGVLQLREDVRRFAWVNGLLTPSGSEISIPRTDDDGCSCQVQPEKKELTFTSRTWVKRWDWIGEFLAWAVLDHVSPWRIHLSSFALANKKASLNVDVLTISGLLYQGLLESALPAADGQLAGVVLSDPQRFTRQAYLFQKDAGKKPNPKDYWKLIPSETFIISGPDISSINVREVVPTDQAFLEELLEALNGKLPVPKKKMVFFNIETFTKGK